MFTYAVKVYNRVGVFKYQITPTSSVYSFSEQVNGGQGEMMLETVDSVPFVELGDIVEIRQSDGSTTRAMYTGIIESIEKREYESATYTIMQVLGVFTALSDILLRDYMNPSNLSFSRTGTTKTLITELLNYFNEKYGVLVGLENIQGTSLLDIGEFDEGPIQTIEFNKESCFSAFEKILENSGLTWHIGADGVVIAKEVGETRFATLGGNCVEVIQKRHKKDMQNSIYIQPYSHPTKYYSDTVSIDNFGPKERFISDPGIGSIETQDIKASNIITQFKNGGTESQAILKPQVYGAYRPGDELMILNSDITGASQIAEVVYSDFSCTLKLGQFQSFGNSLKKIINT